MDQNKEKITDILSLEKILSKLEIPFQVFGLILKTI